MTAAASAPASPCIAVCKLDGMGICTGCYRSADEITEWFMAAPEHKREILARARKRREAAVTIRLD